MQLKKITKLGLGCIVPALLAVLGASSALAWGPERTTFTMETPATYPTFNSITNNPTIGDERDFVRVGEINATETELTNEVEVVPGRQYLVYVYFHNNASATFNDAAHNYSGIATGVKMSSAFPTVLNGGQRGAVSATISANNTNPGAVWDEAYFTTSADKVYLRYIAGSARIYNDFETDGDIMSTDLFTESGTYLTLKEAAIGAIPGCEEYHGTVTYVVQAEELGGSIEKTVSTDGVNYAKGVQILPGDEAYFKIAVSNTGDRALTNVTIKDRLPEGLSLISGSVMLYVNDSTTGNPLSDNIIESGYNLGTLGTGNTVYIVYGVKADDDFDCEGLDLYNEATLVYDDETAVGAEKNDRALIEIQKEECRKDDPEPEKKEDCTTNPNLEGCQEMPNTGPVEIVLAIIIVLGIGGGGWYFYKTRKDLKVAESMVSGGPKVSEGKTETKIDDNGGSQDSENMVK